jgi:hypothetical protein
MFYLSFTEKFFEMNKKSCKEALEIYKKFLSRMDSVKEFLKVAEVGDEWFLLLKTCSNEANFIQQFNSIIESILFRMLESIPQTFLISPR